MEYQGYLIYQPFTFYNQFKYFQISIFIINKSDIKINDIRSKYNLNSLRRRFNGMIGYNLSLFINRISNCLCRFFLSQSTLISQCCLIIQSFQLKKMLLNLIKILKEFIYLKNSARYFVKTKGTLVFDFNENFGILDGAFIVSIYQMLK
ncbi:unnamed protein product (macronuclear) [Paramecium tetraurelia]|uniref:Uncharacterized protein n=1 Tax=Paramecium tetraurelia TaxID=5888 RepID=A0EBK4_PARTE|nr:uncharacterized protein GSPATT00025405001 [Paramecium tetraurelia]CAK92671.1 unnamed protein product [Paramecium tetraurelia]|eukprot:XP_001460068.1 hypothetical protein (macronuclear) [Paramecium tetraurelia strain d4-2]